METAFKETSKDTEKVILNAFIVALRHTNVKMSKKSVVRLVGSLGKPDLENELVLEGVSPEAVQISSWLLGEDIQRMCRFLGFSERTLRSKLKDDKPLDKLPSSTLLYILRAWKVVLKTFNGNQEDAIRWLHTPALALGHKKPIDLMATPQGLEMVENLATALDYGTYL
jgi:putative toxin-antitoxin system antitoxin component (TIGR02293 family)